MIRCLLVEDNDFDRKIIRQTADDCSLTFDLHEASTIQSAEQMIEGEAFDCILLDFLLTDGDGLSFARNFLATDTPQSALIMLTAEGSEELAREAFQLGILDYLPKAQLSPESLERAVSNAVEKIRLQQERRAALEELKRSNEALRRFAVVAAHDLKAPIRHMKVASGFLRDDYRDTLGGDGLSLVETIERGSERAVNMIDGMLAYASLDKAGEERARLDLRSAADDAVANLQSFIAETGAQIEIGELPEIVGIASQFTQVFQNLITNAISFRHPDRQPVISIKSEAVSGGTHRIYVQDNGVGVPAEHLERIFGMLERLHSYDKHKGFGIGLATCRRIIENHGGRIWCQSEEGAGSTFIFDVKAKAEQEPADQDTPRHMAV